MNVIGKRPGFEIGAGIGQGSEVSTGSANAVNTGTGGLTPILKALEIEKSLATDPVVVAPSVLSFDSGRLCSPIAEPGRVPKSRGLEHRYAHRRVAYDLAKTGKTFVVRTPTVSGKTLC